MFRSFHRDEDGVALITTLFAILILVGLSVLFVASATNLTRQSGISTAYERAIHLSEAAVDDIVARASTEDPNDTSTMYVSQWDPGTGTLTDVEYDAATVTDEEAWAIQRADGAPAAAVIDLAEGGGEAVGIRPVDTAGTPLDVIFGVSYVPNRAAPREIRVVKVAFQRKLLNPSFALQTGPACGVTPPPGGLALQGSGRILDGDPSVEPPANVHSNGSISVTGSSFVVEGRVTAGPGQTVGAGISNPDGSAASTAGNQECEEIPVITPRRLYLRSMDENFFVGHTDPANWRWDLCYDAATGTPYARRPSPTGVPCSNTTGQQDLSSVGQFRGWTFDFAKRVWSANAVQGGIYYIHQASAKIGGSDGVGTQHVTVLLEALTTDTAGSGSSCNSHSNTGNLCLRGNPKLSPAFKDTQFVVDRDIEFGGTPGSEFAGFVTAREQIGVTGNAAINGAAIAQDSTDTTGSVLHENIVSGSMVLTFDEDLNPPIDSVVQIVAWNEL